MHLISLEKDKEKVCDMILKSSKVHIDQPNTPISDETIKLLEEKIEKCENAIEILNKYNPAKKSFFSTKTDKIKTPDNDSSQSIISAENQIETCLKKISENKKRIQKLLPFKDFDLPLKKGETKNIKYSILMAKKEITETDLNEKFGYAHTEIIFSSPQKSSIFFLIDQKHKNVFEEAVKKASLYECEIVTEISPKTEIELLTAENQKLNEKIISHKHTLKKLNTDIDDIKSISNRHKMKKQMQKLILLGKNIDKLFTVSGYISQNDARKFKTELEEKCLCHIEFSLPEENEDVPVLFNNNPFASPMESITKTYSLPHKYDIDPNFITAIFYYIFFGMMFSDAGYGLLVSLVCGYLSLKGKPDIRKTMRLFFFCGISTFLWGIMFGSFFGDSISIISQTFLGKKLSFEPLWLDPAKEPLKLLIFSVCLGLVQILTGMGIRFYTLLRQKDYKGAFFDTLSWFFILAGASLSIAGVALKLPVATAGLVIASIGAVTVILTKGRKKKNPIAKIFTGILGLYDITGLVSDVLSYSRLMALGLSTGVIASVVNMMASLAGNSFLGTIVFIIVFVIGHSLNFAINMLGAYVHTNRLQYVEFFSKFYRGGGKAFKAVSYK